MGNGGIDCWSGGDVVGESNGEKGRTIVTEQKNFVLKKVEDQ